VILDEVRRASAGRPGAPWVSIPQCINWQPYSVVLGQQALRPDIHSSPVSDRDNDLLCGR
jgi:hypothetical protein